MNNERKTMTGRIPRKFQWLRYLVLGGILMALGSTNGSLGVSAKEGVEVTSAPLAVEHIVITTMKPYPEVKARIEKLGRFDDGCARC